MGKKVREVGEKVRQVIAKGDNIVSQRKEKSWLCED